MRVLTRRPDESIYIGDGISVIILEIRGGKVIVGVKAPKDVVIHANEVARAVDTDHSNPGLRGGCP